MQDKKQNLIFLSFAAFAFSMLLSIPNASAECELGFTYGEGLMSSFIYDGSRYMLSSYVDESVEILDQDFAFWLPCEAIKADQMSALQKLSGDLSFWRLQLAVQKHYNANRDYHHKLRPIPEDLASFEARYPFHTWPEKFRVKNSTAKNLDRMIFRGEDMSVAQTMAFDKRGREFVRETEVIILRENDSNYSFYVYDAKGQLADETEGINGKADAPFVCMACHYNGKKRLFDLTHR